MTETKALTVLREESGTWVLPLVGREIDQICVDFSVTVVVDGTDSIRIGMPFELNDADGSHVVEPERVETIVPVLRLLGAVVLTAVATAEGSLLLELSGDRSIRVRPHPDYEAWEATGGLPPVSQSYQVIGLPGGGVEIL